MSFDLDLYARFVIALVIVLSLLAVCAWLARRFGFLPGRATSAQRRLAVIEVTPLDPRRRLVLFRRDDIEHLVLLGSDGALLIESGIRNPALDIIRPATIEE